MIATAPQNHSPAKVDHVRLSEIRPSPENDQLYRPVDPSDPEIIALADSIRRLGILEPLFVSADGYIVSGHRRYAAAKLAGLNTVPIRRLIIRRADDVDKFTVLLREHNRQRDKSHAEKLREEVVTINPDEAVAELHRYRRAQAAIDVAPLEIREKQKRKKISEAKRPLLTAMLKILEERRAYWPVSDRQIHYALLNDQPLKHASKPRSVYRNDNPSYNATTELVTRIASKAGFRSRPSPMKPARLKSGTFTKIHGLSCGTSAATCSAATGGT